MEQYPTALSVLENFFRRNPQKGQFYCRGKQLMALTLNVQAACTSGAESIRQRRLALSYVLQALEVAVDGDNKTRYKWLVFNVSVTCWQIVSPFLRSGRAKFFETEGLLTTMELLTLLAFC